MQTISAVWSACGPSPQLRTWSHPLQLSWWSSVYHNFWPPKLKIVCSPSSRPTCFSPVPPAQMALLDIRRDGQMVIWYLDASNDSHGHGRQNLSVSSGWSDLCKQNAPRCNIIPTQLWLFSPTAPMHPNSQQWSQSCTMTLVLMTLKSLCDASND